MNNNSLTTVNHPHLYLPSCSTSLLNDLSWVWVLHTVPNHQFLLGTPSIIRNSQMVDQWVIWDQLIMPLRSFLIVPIHS